MIIVSLTDPASQNHQDQILDLIRKTPVSGAVTYHYERPPGYQAFASTQGTHYHLWKATKGDQLLGFTQITFDQITWNGKTATVAYSGDTRVSPDSYGKGVSNNLIQSACNQSVPVFGAVMGSNKIVLDKKLNDWKKLGVNFKEIAEMKALFFKPAQVKAKTTGIICRLANDSDLQAMYFLWKQYSQKRNLTRAYPDLAAFSHSYFQTPGVSLEKTILVYSGVTLIAMVSLWDQSRIRKLVVDDQSIWIKLLSKFIPLPKTGEELKILYSFQHAFLDDHSNLASALQNIIAKARTIAHQQKFHFFSIGLDSKDPQMETIAKNAMNKNPVKIILDTRNQALFDKSPLPLHLEVGMG